MTVSVPVEEQNPCVKRFVPRAHVRVLFFGWFFLTLQLGDKLPANAQGSSPASPATSAAKQDSRTSHLPWSLQPLAQRNLPSVQNTEWPRNPIDRFILARLESVGLSPTREADRTTLMRRLSFDLLGLPPSPEEIDAFIADRSAHAYEALVDRMLASPRYGERWARHWLDVVRYTESQGFEYDHMRPNAWHYRDYVISSFNSDKPYDQFVREQIAGDAVEPMTPEGVIATSLLVCGPWDQAGNSQANATQKAITREEELEDLISVVAQTFFGLTVNCARCHAHKFDPIPQEDYYRLRAVFAGVYHGERPIAPADEMQAFQQKVAPLTNRIGKAEKEIATIEAEARKRALAERASKPEESGASGKAESIRVSAEELERNLSDEQRTRRDELRNQLKREREALNRIPPPPASYAGIRKQPELTRLLQRGDVKSPGDVVAPGALSSIPQPSAMFDLPPDAPEAERRRKLAAWMTDPRNPLIARAMVNRLWHYHFGAGIVATPNDLGVSGAQPTHPELLDWLANAFIEHRWSIKSLHRLIVCSATYRQDSSFSSRAAAVDADNRGLWRFSPRRLEAEALRDAMLLISGQINFAQGGPSFRPFDTKSFNATFYFPTNKPGPEFARRTVYRMNVNSGKDPLLDAFDCPDPSTKTPRRNVTTTPLQALGLMNDAFVQQQAAGLADRVLKESKASERDAITRAYRYALGRAASASELDRAISVAQRAGMQTVCWSLFNATEFVYVK